MPQVKRNWLKEAYEIHSGDKNIKVKREHVIALVDSIAELAKKTQKLHSVMHLAYAEACKKRNAQGLPVPPVPESLRNYAKAPK